MPAGTAPPVRRGVASVLRGRLVVAGTTAHAGEAVRRGRDARTLDVLARGGAGGVQLPVGVDRQRDACLEQRADPALAAVGAVVGSDDAGDQLTDAARAVAEQGDPLPGEVVVEVEQRASPIQSDAV